MNLKLTKVPKAFYIFLNKKWHFDQIVNELIVVKIMNFGYLTTFQSLDKGLIERLGPTGFTVSIYNTSSAYTRNLAGLIHNTSFVFITFALVFLSFFTLGSLDLLNATNISFGCVLLGYLILNVTKNSTKEN